MPRIDGPVARFERLEAQLVEAFDRIQELQEALDSTQSRLREVERVTRRAQPINFMP